MPPFIKKIVGALTGNRRSRSSGGGDGGVTGSGGGKRQQQQDEQGGSSSSPSQPRPSIPPSAPPAPDDGIQPMLVDDAFFQGADTLRRVVEDVTETEHALWLKSFAVFVVDKPGKEQLVEALQETDNFFMLDSTKFDDQDSSVVDKVLHCPEQMHRLCNSLSQGSSRHCAKNIDFDALDRINVAVHGMYGDFARAIDELRRRDVVDEESESRRDYRRSQPARPGHCGIRQPVQRGRVPRAGAPCRRLLAKERACLPNASVHDGRV
mmetsp:Transcript_41904/g.67331  ORF Transcript_41904/g.67331 Transcript_41904/m.67331 type:complete len:265 (-) Transcript_41904:1431-2225(-)